MSLFCCRKVWRAILWRMRSSWLGCGLPSDSLTGRSFSAPSMRLNSGAIGRGQGRRGNTRGARRNRSTLYSARDGHQGGPHEATRSRIEQPQPRVVVVNHAGEWLARSPNAVDARPPTRLFAADRRQSSVTWTMTTTVASRKCCSITSLLVRHCAHQSRWKEMW